MGASRFYIKQKASADEKTINKEEILAGIDAGLKEIKLTMEGKLESKTANEFLHELRNSR